MSAFEVTFTPTRLKNKKPLESHEPTMVIMAPFSAKAIVQFENVPVTKTAKRILCIINPSDEDIQVKVNMRIPAEHNLTIQWTENIVPAQKDITMEIVWNPQMQVACTETLQLLDNRNFRKNIMVILKSKTNNPPKNMRKFPTVGKTLKLKSPTSVKKQTKYGIQQKQQQKRYSKPVAIVNRTSTTSTKQLWKNIPQKLNNKKPYTADDLLGNAMNNLKQPPLAEKNVYAVTCEKELLFQTPQRTSCKENISPQTPCSILSIIDQMQFTPITDIVKKSTQRENLLLLPTPAERNYAQALEPIKLNDIRPRCLITQKLLIGEDEALCMASASHIDTNKTFDVKHNESPNIFSDTTNEFVQTPPSSNKTTTIMPLFNLHPLHIIQEEDAFSSQSDSLTPNNVNKYDKSGDLKRDIKLVGIPLRKYSESMKNLSLQSPQVNVLIQGSMPNLNEMEEIRSIEQNRYFQQKANKSFNINEALEDQYKLQLKSQKSKLSNDHADPNLLDNSSTSENSIISNNELLFNQNEILAQSSRFNLHEIDIKSRKNSPVSTKTIRQSICQDTPTKAAKNLNCNNNLNIIHKRRSQELSYSDSESLLNETHITQNPSSSMSVIMEISPPKRKRTEMLFNLPKDSSSIHLKNWSQSRTKNVKLTLRKRPVTSRKTREEPSIKLYDSNLYLQSCINPDPFAASTTADPFLTSTMYLDEQAVEKHQADLKKWLNALVSIPDGLDADCNSKIDVGKLFNEVRNKELILAPTKEEQCMNYLTNFRLESLRRAAVELFFSEDMRQPCSKVAVYINKRAICIRNDRNLHLDVVMQRYILELLLCFNPLWLRLGLEVIYAEKIHLHSNNDIIGLSTFILNRLFRNKLEEQKFSKAYTLSDEYARNIKKYTLQKMLFLLLFLDKAKEKCIIKHNPCLFVKKSPHKETKDILLRISSELLANVGDITRELKRLGYVLQHKQTFLDEFDYAFNNLAVDLRDGVRLTKVMEIILLRDDLTKQLRAPAISRLQRIFNVNLALRALNEADFKLTGDIAAPDIVDGHREKTLSLLWQIIYKFRSPKFHAAALVLQYWWRRIWLRVIIMRRIREKEKSRREKAAAILQALFRGHKIRKYAKAFREERTQAAIVLQKYARRYLAQKQLYRKYASAVYIQRWYRGARLTLSNRAHFLCLRRNIIFVQRCWRRNLLVRKLLLIADQVRLHVEQKRQTAAVCIQTHWRAYCLGCKTRQQYEKQRQLITWVQRRMRATWEMKVQKQIYHNFRIAVISIQHRFRAYKLMLEIHRAYKAKRDSVLKLQQRWRGLKAMRVMRAKFLKEKQYVLFVQRKMRAKWQMRKERRSYIQLKHAIYSIQCRYRARLAMKEQMIVYQKIRLLIITVQRRWRATLLMRYIRLQYIVFIDHVIRVQRKFRAIKLMRIKRAQYLCLQQITIQIQRLFRAKLQARQERAQFQQMKWGALVIQKWYRGYKLMRFLRAKYQGTKTAVTYLQRHIRGYMLMKRLQHDYQRRKRAVIVLQRAYRCMRLMQKEQENFQKLRASVLIIQQRFRSTLIMRRQKTEYVRQRELIIGIQRHFRANLLGRQVRKNYMKIVMTVVYIQQRFRATLLMRRQRKDYEMMRNKIILLQNHIKAYLTMNKVRLAYVMNRNAALSVQRWYRSILQMRQQQYTYLELRNSALTIQRKWRATLAARLQRIEFIQIVESVRLIQRVLRATLQMRTECLAYQLHRDAAITLQRYYRARRLMLQVRSQYLLVKLHIVCIQRKYRARVAMRKARSEYLLLKRTTVHLQQKYRGRILMLVQRKNFLLLRRTIIIFQAHLRGNLARSRFQALMTPEMVEFLRRKKAAKIIQRYWRGYHTRKSLRSVSLQAIRKRIVKLRQEQTALNSVRAKVQEAVRFLSGRFIASDALGVLNRLDRLSRTVPHLLMWCSEFMSTFCYGIMAQAIRSEVDKQLIECSSRVILNLARYNSTTVNTFQQGGLVTIAQMLLRWCDKDCEIFNTLCTLIWVFSHCPKKRRIIRDFMTTTDAIYMVRETKKLVARKEKMKQNARKPPPGSLRPSQNFSPHALPSLKPDFGIIRYHPYTFISSVFAFNTILCKLGINCI